jgi:hypothetical protein
MQVKDYAAAIELFTKAIIIESSNFEAKFYRALCYLDSLKQQEAIQEL